jgi:hypothetical protein
MPWIVNGATSSMPPPEILPAGEKVNVIFIRCFALLNP